MPRLPSSTSRWSSPASTSALKTPGTSPSCDVGDTRHRSTFAPSLSAITRTPRSPALAIRSSSRPSRARPAAVDARMAAPHMLVPRKNHGLPCRSKLVCLRRVVVLARAMLTNIGSVEKAGGPGGSCASIDTCHAPPAISAQLCPPIVCEASVGAVAVDTAAVVGCGAAAGTARVEANSVPARS